jgi:hypothetical protein
MDQALLRLLIREKLATGCLPRYQTPRIWGSPGNGEICDGCGGTVTRVQMLMEGALDALGCGVRFHVECFALWDAERQVADREPSNSSADVR